jgi:hypothetical protein
MIVQWWGHSLETSVIKLSCVDLTAYPNIRLGLSLVFARASILRSATQRKLEFPCRGGAPAVARCLSLPDCRRHGFLSIAVNLPPHLFIECPTAVPAQRRRRSRD